jgi:hypothetical protein
MKYCLTATAALLALATQAQVAGPNRPGPGTSPGTFQTPGSASSSIQATTPDPAAPQITTPDSAAISVAPPIANPAAGPLPRTSIGTPDATGGAQTDSLRARSSLPSSRDWETGAVGGARDTTSRRISPPDITPPLQPIEGARSGVRGSGLTNSSALPTEPALPTDLNTSGVNTPARINEMPLDRATSAKIRAELSQSPRNGTARLSPETIRDLRITSQGGKVILEGAVNSPAEKQLLEMQARQVPGVVAVENRVNVRDTAVGAPATSQTGQQQQKDGAASSEHPEISPDF